MSENDKSGKVTDAGATELKEDQLDQASGGGSSEHPMESVSINFAKAPAPGAAKIPGKKMGGD